MIRGFESQGRLSGSCGQAALRHALLLVGIPVPEATLRRVTRSSFLRTALFGVDEDRLKHAIRQFGCRPAERACRSASTARTKIDDLLARGVPLIAAVDDDEHWITISGRDGDRYHWIDSADPDLLGTSTWTRLAARMNANGSYYALGIRPRCTCHSLVPRIRQYASHVTNPRLGAAWGRHLARLEQLLGPFGCKSASACSAADDLFRVPSLTARLPPLEAHRDAEDLHLVAEAHRLFESHHQPSTTSALANTTLTEGDPTEGHHDT